MGTERRERRLRPSWLARGSVGEELRAIPRTLRDKLWYQGTLGDLVVVTSTIGSGEYLTPQPPARRSLVACTWL